MGVSPMLEVRGYDCVMSSPQLDYAPPPPLHRRRTFRRWTAVVFLLASAASAWWWVPPLRRRIELLYWQHHCMNYTPANGQAAVAGKNNGITSQFTPIEWSKFNALLPTPFAASDGIAFMHELKKPSGERRLVVVEMRWDGDFIGLSEKSVIHVFTPGSLIRPPREVVRKNEQFASLGVRTYFVGNDTSSIYAGLVDAADPSHFTIRMRSGTQELTYDGRLRDDESIQISERDPIDIAK